MRHALALLEWYVEAGVDEAILDTPQDRFAEYQQALAARSLLKAVPAQEPAKPRSSSAPTATLAPTPRAAAASVAAPSTTQGLAEIIAQAREAANGCDTVAALKQAVENFDGCALRKLATNTVFAEGNPNASIMLIGEAPGAEEDREGKPFCGASGQLLDRMLGAIGLSRQENIYITNMLFWRPPGNRQPTPDELEICRPFVDRHIALVQPKLIILAGGTSAKFMLGASEGITKLRRQQHELTVTGMDHSIHSFATFHPAYLLRQPAHKALSWQDLLAIKAYITEHQLLAGK